MLFAKKVLEEKRSDTRNTPYVCARVFSNNSRTKNKNMAKKKKAAKKSKAKARKPAKKRKAAKRKKR